MLLEEKFNKAINEWVEYSNKNKHMSDIKSKISEDAANKIIEMGYDALPFIRNLYNKKTDENKDLMGVRLFGVPYLLYEIIGRKDFQIPNEIAGQMPKIDEFTKNWLDENMSKYTQES